MRPFLIFAATTLLLSGCNKAPSEPMITITGARVQLPAVPGRPGTAYFTLESNNDPTKLVGISSPSVERIELHETITEGGVARMRAMASTPFPQDLKLVFAPGAKHAMLFGIDPSVKAGDKVQLTFALEPMAQPVTAEAEVVAFGAGINGHGGH